MVFNDFTIVASLSNDILIRDNSRNIREGGPGFFIKGVFDRRAKSYDFYTTREKVNVEIVVLDDSEKGKIDFVSEIEIDEKLRNSNVIVSTILDEFDLSKLELFKGICALDLQGYVREKSKFGAKKYFSNFSKYISLIDVLKATEEEILFVDETLLKKIPVVIITNGSEGGRVLSRGIEIVRYASELIEVLDSVGAGDTFFARFFIEYCYTGNISKSVIVAKKEVEKFLRSS